MARRQAKAVLARPARARRRAAGRRPRRARRRGEVAAAARLPASADSPGLPPPPPDEDTDPADEAAPAGLTGMDLIERELGGRVIEEIG